MGQAHEDGLALASRLRGAGLKATGPRLAILSSLEADGSHPSAEQVHARLTTRHPSLSLSTVYATLEAFTEAGLIRRINGSDGRLRVDGTHEDHDHAVCRDCGVIFDIDREHLTRARPPDRLPPGLRVLRVRVEYEVVCPACAPKHGTRPRAASSPTNKMRSEPGGGEGPTTSTPKSTEGETDG